MGQNERKIIALWLMGPFTTEISHCFIFTNSTSCYSSPHQRWLLYVILFKWHFFPNSPPKKNLNKQGLKGTHSLLVRKPDNWTFKSLHVLALIVWHGCSENISLYHVFSDWSCCPWGKSGFIWTGKRELNNNSRTNSSVISHQTGEREKSNFEIPSQKKPVLSVLLCSFVCWDFCPSGDR